MTGEFNIQVVKVGADGLKKDPKTPKVGPSPKKKGPVPRPFLERGLRSQQYEAATIAENQDPNALFKAAASKIGDVDKDKAYVMHKMDNTPGAASKFKKLYIRNKKKKGMY